MNKSKLVFKFISIFTAAMLVNSTFAYGAISQVQKKEYVYVTMDQSGNQKKVIVSDWLHSDSQGTEIHDRTSLDDIANVKGDEKPIKNGDELIWRPIGNDIYYRGTTDKKIPLKIGITYYLNGEEISPNKLGGKSGKVKIQIKFINTGKHDVPLSSGLSSIYTPITVAGTVNLPTETFKNVSIDNGKIFTEGNNQVAVFAAVPGLNESLGLDKTSIKELKDIDFHDTIEITADADNFKLGTMMFTATPELPDMDKIKKSDDFDEMKDNLNKLNDSLHDIDVMDPDKEIRSLITDFDNVSRSRVLIGDAFDFYGMDKALIDIAPDYVTDENIALYDRVKADLKDVDIDYALDNKTFRSLPDRLTDENIDKSRVLMDDADEIKTLDKDKLDPFLDVLKRSKELDGFMDKSDYVINSLEDEDNEEAIDTLKVLPKYSGRIMHIMDDIDDLSMGGLLTEDDINDAANAALDAVFDKKEKQLDAVIDSGKIEDDDLKDSISSIVESAMDYTEDEVEQNPVNKNTKDIIDIAISRTSDPQKLEELKQLSTYAAIVINDPESLGEQAQQVEATVKKGAISIIEAQKDTYLQLIESGNIAPIGDDLKKIVSQAMKAQKANVKSSGKISGLIGDLSGFKKSLKRDLGDDYKDKLIDSMKFMQDMIPKLDDLKEEYDDHKKLIDKIRDLVKDDDKMDYLREWGPKLMDMKDDMDDNDENIQLLKDLLKEYDDPKIRHLKDRAKDLQKDMDDARPILKSLSDRLDDKHLNECFHNSPKDVVQLMKMKNDLEDNKRIVETLKDATTDKNVDIANRLIDNLEEAKSKNTADKYLNELDDIGLLFQKKDALVKLSNDNKVFTNAGDNTDTSTSFIMKTDEIKRPEVIEVAHKPVQEDTGFFSWLKKTFRKVFGLGDSSLQ